VLERGMPRFFRRLAEGVLDQEDLVRRTDELAEFVAAAVATYNLRRDGIVAVGFSNGANIAAGVLLRRPSVLRGAVLLSPMLPFEPEARPDLSGTAVFIGAGRADTMVPDTQTERLAILLREAGAEVTVHWTPGGTRSRLAKSMRRGSGSRSTWRQVLRRVARGCCGRRESGKAVVALSPCTDPTPSPPP
jgi:phospholipase/carboxylesterase